MQLDSMNEAYSSVLLFESVWLLLPANRFVPALRDAAWPQAFAFQKAFRREN